MQTLRNLRERRFLTGKSAGITGAEDLQVVADLSEAVLLGNGICPTLYCRSRDLDGTPTDTANQMMMMMTS